MAGLTSAAAGSPNRKSLPDKGECLVPIGEFAVLLEFLDKGENCFEGRTRRVACALEVVAGQKAGRRLHIGEPREPLGREGMIVQSSVAGQAVQTMQFEVLLEIRLPQEALELGRAHAPYFHEFHMVAYQGQDAVAMGVRHA